MPIYRLFADAEGHTHLEEWPAEALHFESGPGPFKGLGGTVLGDASRVMLMRLEAGARPALHRANPGLAVLLEGELVVRASDGSEVELHPGDAVRLESMGNGGRGGAGGWSPVNPSKEALALLALVQMPSAAPGP